MDVGVEDELVDAVEPAALVAGDAELVRHARPAALLLVGGEAFRRSMPPAVQMRERRGHPRRGVAFAPEPELSRRHVGTPAAAKSVEGTSIRFYHRIDARRAAELRKTVVVILGEKLANRQLPVPEELERITRRAKGVAADGDEMLAERIAAPALEFRRQNLRPVLSADLIRVDHAMRNRTLRAWQREDLRRHRRPVRLDAAPVELVALETVDRRRARTRPSRGIADAQQAPAAVPAHDGRRRPVKGAVGVQCGGDIDDRFGVEPGFGGVLRRVAAIEARGRIHFRHVRDQRLRRERRGGDDGVMLAHPVGEGV